MNIFKTNTKLEMQELISELQDTNTSLKKELEDSHRTISGFVDVKATYEASMEKMKVEYNTRVKALEGTLSETEKSVNAKVNEALAGIGITTFPSENIMVGSSKSPTEIMETFNSLSGIEKTEFFRKHREEINKALSVV